MTRPAHMMPPEPCIKGRCFSPTACNGWGYCRERNEGYEPTSEYMAKCRALAQDRSAKEQA